MDLVELPGRPVPEGVRAGTITTPDGVPLRYARWDAIGAPRKGTVVVCQGRSEFIEKYFEVIDELRARGFGVLAFDWRGQGGSGRLLSEIRKGHVRRFSDYQIDLETIMSVVALPDCRPPFYALGHSMGGSILIETAHEGRTWFDRMVLTAPMISLAQIASPGLLRAVMTALSLVGLGGSLIPGGSLKPTSKKPFEGNPVTSDEQRYRQAASYSDIDPRLGLGAPTISWLREALKVTGRFAAPFYAEDIRQPMLIIASAKDGLVSTPKVEAFGRRLKGGHTVVIPDARHEVMMERDALRAEFWGAFDAFVPGEQPFL
ncbi:alpha/beta hydrolase [Phreatobacter aquaticus]|uniref:Alpha/beta hydrolase n=1 Tax=Phreatobacter aquaticus TaxID=2570229 RepID=A0A4D7QF60_9HYPH|nr:alpha/beta hydrolase [Phreatobacter aquaticus]QCK84429.1 alpha/beta hydrolase [Phreatobacter aquaticus]